MNHPTSTYRLQFREGMTFDRAAELVPYWKNLGISHLYASPIFAATKGSTHGYDVVDPNRLDPELGGHAAFDRLSDALQSQRIGLILDIVPNHMAASLENSWWSSVVEWGESSRYAHHFDIDWGRRLTLPFLASSVEDAVSKGELALVADRERGNLALSLSGLCLPINPSCYAAILPGEDPMFLALADAAAGACSSGEDAFHALVRQIMDDSVGIARLERRLANFSQDVAAVKWLHDKQSWRLIHWRDAPRDLSYRRFFEVTGLVGVNVEDPGVFEDTHRLVIDLVKTGRVDGLRVDHIDGLSDPAAYLLRLRHAVGDDVYLTVEKILEDGEALPREWPVSGTTGYEFISTLVNLFVHPAGAKMLQDDYSGLGGPAANYGQAFREAKLLMITENFKGEVATLNRLAGDLATAETVVPASEAIEAAMRALLVALPVYRTYGTAEGLGAGDRQLLARVSTEAGTELSETESKALAFITQLLHGDAGGGRQGKAALFRRRFQQLTGPLMAKSLEDTLFYRHMPMLAVNEVGGDPSRDDYSADQFHAFMADRSKRWPLALSATATHDTKRGEDSRARLYAITEMPTVWSAAVERWRRMNAGFVAVLPDGLAPEPELEWALLQAIAGTWPHDLQPHDDAGLAAFVERLIPYAEKAMREAKLRSNWTDVDQTYEDAVKTYIRSALTSSNSVFLEDFYRTLQPLIHAGALNSLTQTLIKLMAPGIPDTYQGSERLDLSFVDPDNRRPPDFATLSSFTGNDQTPPADGLLDGRLKQAIIHRGLMLRSGDRAIFDTGSYRPLPVSGAQKDHVVAFAREIEDRAVLVLAPRLTMRLISGASIPAERWEDTTVTMPPSSRDFSDKFSGRRFTASEPLRLADVLDTYPVALLSNA